MEKILNNIIFMISYTSCLNLLKLNTNPMDGKSTIEPINTTFNIIRRQQKTMHPSLKPPSVPGMKIKTGENDGYYEPYWENGDWVFYRQTSTNRPQGFFLNQGSTKHRECNQICLEIYQDYGPVCGMRLTRDEWTYENKTFKNMCYLELANCEHDTKRYAWYPANKGNCSDWMTTHPTNSTAIEERLSTWLKNYI